MRTSLFAGLLVSSLCLAAPLTVGDPAEFPSKIKPTLQQNCAACHNPENPKNRIDFLKAETAKDIESKRGLWRDVAAQLRNRTMPPVASKLEEADRLHIANWIEDRLRITACSGGEFAGAAPARRLNRREYHNTVRDLLGVDFVVSDVFPADESGGAGFDTNGETLFIPPVMLERYMDAAQKIVDRVVITPPFVKVTMAANMQPPLPNSKPGRSMGAGEEFTTTVSVFAEGKYDLKVSIERPPVNPVQMEVKLDGTTVGSLGYARDPNGGPTVRAQSVTLTRGPHTIGVVAGKAAVTFYSLTVEQKLNDIPAEKRALHYRLFGTEPFESPLDGRKSAERLLSDFLPKAYRHPVDKGEAIKFLTLYDRAEKRGDPYEERVKLMLKAVLVSPRFLFRVEQMDNRPGIHPLDPYDLASRLSYFLWSTMPDPELLSLASSGKLQEEPVLRAQVDRMLNDPRSRTFVNAFVGQWLGTQDVGGRVVPLLTELQHFYTPEAAADLREEPVLLFQNIVNENRSLLELLTANYTFLTERLVKFYELEGKVQVSPTGFTRVEWPDKRRAGILGMASVLAMTSHYKAGSPVLRGAWVLDTLLGTPVPPPPPDVPPLEAAGKTAQGTMRSQLMKHRENQACATCHNLMDPIGFGLENFDWMGRWRDEESNGQPVDASGVLPSGEKFNGPIELRQVLLSRKEEFTRHLAGKVFGFALGRSLQDGDQCTVQKLVDSLAKDDYRARSLITDVVLSTAFRNTQGGVVLSSAPAPVPVKRSRAPLLGEK